MLTEAPVGSSLPGLSRRLSEGVASLEGASLEGASSPETWGAHSRARRWC